tara:strand:- start:253 stop:570 length:318 start_codon:yes stop_codon:yes gene_type:complete
VRLIYDSRAVFVRVWGLSMMLVQGMEGDMSSLANLQKQYEMMEKQFSDLGMENDDYLDDCQFFGGGMRDPEPYRWTDSSAFYSYVYAIESPCSKIHHSYPEGEKG